MAGNYWLLVIVLLVFVGCSDDSDSSKIVPMYVSSFPADGADGVVVSSEVFVTFDEVISLSDNHGITVNGEPVEASAQLTKIFIDADLEKNTEYSVRVPEGAVVNTSGVPSHETVEFSFFTETEPEAEPVDISNELVVSDPSQEAQNVYKFLQENYGEKIISGTVANVSWNTNEADWVQLHTGKHPALNGFDLIHLYASPASWINYEDVSVVEDWWNNNGLVSIMWHWNVPDEEGGSQYAFYTDETSFSIARAVEEGTWENDVIMADLEKASTTLELLRDKNIPVLWRPLHEAAGGWFWWGAGSAQNCKDLWRIIFDYFESKNLNNLIWVWTAEPGDDSWYPGDEYVDIVSRDLYNQNSAEGTLNEFENIQNRFPDMMVTYGEIGSVAPISDQWKQGAYWSWFMTWYDYNRTIDPNAEAFQETSHMYGDIAWWEDAVSHDAVITRDEMPDLK